MIYGVVLFALVFGYGAFLYFVVRHYWRRLKKATNAKAFNYHISDIWAAMLALTPTFVVIAIAAENSRGEIVWVALASIMFSAQLSGIVIGRVTSELPGFGSSALRIIGAGIMGLFLPVIYMLVVIVPTGLVLYCVDNI